MIPVALVGGFFARYWRWAVGVALVAVVVLWLMSIGAGLERRRLQPKIDTLRAELTQIKAAHRAAAEQAAAERHEQEVTARERITEIQAHYDTRIQAGNAALDAALGELRRARAVRSLAPAGAAPAPCRDYEAGPEQLSAAHAEFLIREAARADATVEQLTACQRYAVTLHQVCSAPEGH